MVSEQQQAPPKREYGHDQVDTRVQTRDGTATVSTWRSYFIRAVNRWVFGVQREGKLVETRVFGSRAGRDAAAAEKVEELAATGTIWGVPWLRWEPGMRKWTGPSRDRAYRDRIDAAGGPVSALTVSEDPAVDGEPCEGCEERIRRQIVARLGTVWPGHAHAGVPWCASGQSDGRATTLRDQLWRWSRLEDGVLLTLGQGGAWFGDPADPQCLAEPTYLDLLRAVAETIP